MAGKTAASITGEGVVAAPGPARTGVAGPAATVRRIRASSLRTPITAPPDGTVSLALGEPSFDTPEFIRRAMAEALAAGATHYCDQQGIVELREALARKESRPGTAALSAHEVLVTHGGSGGLAAAILALVDPGDVVAIEDPTFSLYADLVAAAGGTVTTFGRTADGSLDRDELRAAVRDASLVVVCQPSNPTGRVLSAADWAFLAEVTQGRGTLVLSDEAYSALVYQESSFTSVLDVPQLAGRAILCQTFSKTYAMTGWRLGFLVGPRPVIDAAALVQRTLNGSLNTAVQRAGVVALRDGEESVRSMLEIYRHRRDVMREALAGVPGLRWQVPDGAFYFFCRYPAAVPSLQVAAMAREAGVLVRPGREFGSRGEGHIRLSFAAGDEVITEGVRRLAPVIAGL
jgi:aspartate aminotransferase